jgi:hypothetical protein
MAHNQKYVHGGCYYTLPVLLGVAGALSYGATVGVAAGSVDAATFVAGSGEAATVVAKSELAEVVTPSVLKTP